MRPNSLAFRLFAAAAAWSLVVLPVTALVLISVYRGAVERNFDARLNLFLNALVARTAQASGDLTENPPALRAPQFRLPFSGWYWQIEPSGTSGQPALTSESLLDQRLSLPDHQGPQATPQLVNRGYIPGPENQLLRYLERIITIDQGGSGTSSLSITVAGDSAEIETVIDEFRTLLVVALTILGLGLALATYFQVWFGLKPLRAIGQGLAAIRSGESERLEGNLPAEIVPLKNELNALLQSNRAIVERARTHVGNLAHALKTPLSVITNEAAGKRTPFATKVIEQARLMGDQITHHLNRASMAARSGVIGGQTHVKPVVGSLIRTLKRIYEKRGVRMQVDCPEDTVFHGEKHDFEEMVGNILDNACKWARSTVKLTVRARPGKILIAVEDDGPGLPEKERVSAIKRGRRLDETKPGAGLGLSIVAELSHLYKGKLTLKESGSGGLLARLELPGS